MSLKANQKLLWASLSRRGAVAAAPYLHVNFTRRMWLTLSCAELSIALFKLLFLTVAWLTDSPLLFFYGSFTLTGGSPLLSRVHYSPFKIYLPPTLSVNE